MRNSLHFRWAVKKSPSQVTAIRSFSTFVLSLKFFEHKALLTYDKGLFTNLDANNFCHVSPRSFWCIVSTIRYSSINCFRIEKFDSRICKTFIRSCLFKLWRGCNKYSHNPVMILLSDFAGNKWRRSGFTALFEFSFRIAFWSVLSKVPIDSQRTWFSQF